MIVRLNRISISMIGIILINAVHPVSVLAVQSFNPAPKPPVVINLTTTQLIGIVSTSPNYDRDVLQPLQAKEVAEAAALAKANAIAAQKAADVARVQAAADAKAAQVAAQQAQNLFNSHNIMFADTYDWGNCTWYVASLRGVPQDWGNANNWAWAAQQAGWTVGNTPVIGAIAQTTLGYYGHVAYVVGIGDGTVTVQEMNVLGLNMTDTQTYPVGYFTYIY